MQAGDRAGIKELPAQQHRPRRVFSRDPGSEARATERPMRYAKSMKTAELTIRLMFHRDLAQVLAIEKNKPDRPWTRQDFSPVFRAPNTDGWVAEVNEAVAGYIVFQSTPDGVLLQNIAVAPYWRRQGIARTMLGRLSEKKPTLVRAVVPETNLALQLLLKSADFRAVGVCRGRQDDGDRYVMERAAPTDR
jgi:[ribosomal protein S18]-alanine N-acetyltransferase